MSEPIRVLHVLDDAQPGGGMTHLLQLARWLDRNRVDLAFALPDDGPLPDALRQRGFPVHPLRITGRLDPLAVLRLANLYRGNIQLLHSHNARANVHARLAGRIAGKKPIISTVHNSVFKYEVPPNRQRLYAAAERWTACWATRIVAVSNGIAQELVSRYRIPASKVVVIPNGVDLERLHPQRSATAVRAELNAPESALLVAQVGRMTVQKGFDILLDAVARLKASIPELVVICVGDGPQRVRLESLSHQLGLMGCVRFLGQRQDVPDLLAAADLVTVASRSEGMPYTLLEAMGLGCPVVATRIGGILDVVQDGRNGLLVPEEDPDALARGISSLLRDKDRRLTLGEAARTHVVARFTAQRAAESLMALYEDLLPDSRQ